MYVFWLMLKPLGALSLTLENLPESKRDVFLNLSDVNRLFFFKEQHD